MRINNRLFHVQQVGNKISSSLIDTQHITGLTDIEMLQILSQEQQRILKYMLRAERHPDDSEKGADEE